MFVLLFYLNLTMITHLYFNDQIRDKYSAFDYLCVSFTHYTRVGVNNSAAKHQLGIFVYLVKDLPYLKSAKDVGQGISFILHATQRIYVLNLNDVSKKFVKFF